MPNCSLSGSLQNLHALFEVPVQTGFEWAETKKGEPDVHPSVRLVYIDYLIQQIRGLL